MNHITKKQLAQLGSEAEVLLTSLAGKKSIDDILADIYESGIEGATNLQGLTAAARVIYEVKSFDLDLSEAAEDPDIWPERFLWRLSRGLDLKERCNLWAAVANACYVVVLKGGKNDEEAGCAAKEFAWYEVSGELESQLKSQAKKALQKSGLMMAVVSEQIDVLETIDNAYEEKQLLLYYMDREVEFRAAAAMLAYVKIKNGVFKNISSEITLPQTAALVCAATEHVRVNAAVGKGKLPKERAAEILTFIGMYVLGAFLVNLAADGFEALLPYLGIVRSAAGVLAVILPLFYLLAAAYEKIEEGCRHILDFACAALGDAVCGAKEMFKYMKEKTGAAAEDKAGSDIPEFEDCEKGVKKKGCRK